MIFEIQTINNIYEIQYVFNTYNEVAINTKKLKYTGTLRYVFKYALWALKVGGEIKVIDEPFHDFGFSTKRIDFWQIRHEFFKSLKDDIEILELDDKKGLIRVKKIKESYINNGFSFGIVFSGSEGEKEQLAKSVQSILGNTDLNKYDYEVIICGPSKFDSESYLKKFSSFNVRYLPFEFEQNAKRLMITQKKNYLYENCKYNIVSINHTRILYAQDFMIKIFDKKFDVFTPKVIVDQDGKWYKYLDFGLIGSYDLSKLNPSAAMTSVILNEDVLYYMRKRVPYIDGGITVFNKDIIVNAPYNPHLAWGEAEDIDFCASLYNDGLLMDYINGVICKSSSNKSIFPNSYIQKLKFNIKKYLIT
jgi:hypothetical protein